MVLGQYAKDKQLIDSETVCQACGASGCRSVIARGVRCYVQCAHCGSYRLVPQPTSGELSTYYANMARSGNYAVSAAHKHSNIRKFSGLLELIQSTRSEYGIAPFQTLLDIGCFDGTFLAVPLPGYKNCAAVKLFVTRQTRRAIGRDIFAQRPRMCADPESAFEDVSTR